MTIPLATAVFHGRTMVGVGLDVASVSRFSAALERTPEMAERLFTPAERVTGTGMPRTNRSLAARFAAKEAVAKALGVPVGLQWHDCVIEVARSGQPEVATFRTVAKACSAAGISSWALSLSHDADIAAAVAVALA